VSDTAKLPKPDFSDTAKLPKPDFSAALQNPTGHVEHDDRGNAVWQWAGDKRLVTEALHHPALSIDETPAGTPGTPAGNVVPDKKAARVGYNPYEVGPMEKKSREKRPDLRELSRWIELRRKVSENQGGEEEE
jgi:hypothetical protein